MTECSICQAPISGKGKTGLCNLCHLARVARPGRTPKPYAPKFCACGTELSRPNRTGRCKPCAVAWLNSSTDIKARRVKGLHRMMAARPEWRERVRALGRLERSPEFRERARQTCTERRLWEYGLPKARTPEANAKRGRSLTEAKLGWCPRELRDHYRTLTKNHGYKAAEARAMILEQHEKDMAAFRRKCLGAAA